MLKNHDRFSLNAMSEILVVKTEVVSQQISYLYTQEEVAVDQRTYKLSEFVYIIS